MPNPTFVKISSDIASSFVYPQRNFLAPKGLSFAYIRYRFLRPLLKGYYKLFNLFNPNRPWTSQASIRIFEAILQPHMRGVEYGSGRSTRFFATRLAHLTSIEHHKGWYEKVRKEIRDLKNVDFVLIEPVFPPLPRKATYQKYMQREEGALPRWEYYPYFEYISGMDDESLDFVLVDGRARVDCMFNALPKLKSGGILVLDNSERPQYAEIHQALAGWPKVNTTTGLTDTTFWFKP
jgi:hypothetical protein